MASVSASPQEVTSEASFEPFVPPLVQRWLARSPTPPVHPLSERFTAAVLFADITGFTPLTEHFARQGDRGAEVVQEILNRCFGRMVDLVLDSGGEVVKFAGDAMLALWPAGDDAQLPLAVRRAGRCGLAIQETLDGLDAAGSGRLRLRLGIGAGEVWAVCVGGLHGSWEALVGGAPLREAAQAEHQAKPGEVLLSASAWALVQGECEGIPAESCVRLLRTGNLPRPVPSTAERPSRPALAAFIPPVVLRRLEAGQHGFLSEFRQVSVLFAAIREADGSAPESLERLQAAAGCFQEMVDRYGGSVNQLLVEDKGMTFVAGWGVPFHSHEDDAARSVLAAMDVHVALRDRGFAPAVGVAGGRVFTGTRGNARRLEYALIGAKVNLASRLMQAAGGRILCDASTRDAAARQVLFEELPPLSIKGKAGPVAVFRPLRRERRDLKRWREREVVGRQEELRLLAAELEALRSGAGGGVIVLGAEPGMGKSLLVSVLLDRARETGLRTFLAASESLDRSTAYYPFREVFGQILGLGGDSEAQRSLLLSRLGPDSAARASLLNPVLPFALEETPATLQMTPEARGEVSRRLLVDLFKQGTEGEPALLVVEDAHWLDTASWSLVEELRQQVKDLLLVVATRPVEEDEMTPEHRRWLAEPGVRRVQLGALRAEESVALACRRLGVRTLPLPAVDLIQAKPEGNPLFVEELALALRDRGLLRIEEGQARLAVDGEELAAMSFPSTVQGAIAGRIDRLSPEQQLTLKVASVFGRSFDLHALVAVHPLDAGEGELRAQIESLMGVDLLQAGEPDPDPVYLFKHAIIQEVAYGLLPYAQRRPLHGAVAGWIERSCEGSPTWHPLLAHHWREAGEAGKALDHFEKAGEHALTNFANREAARFFGAAVELTDEVGSETERRSLLELRLGKAHVNAADYVRSQAHLEAGLALLDRSIPGPAMREASAAAGEVVRQAAHRIWTKRFFGRARERREARLEAASAYEALAEVYFYTNQPLLMFYSVLRELNLAEEAGSSAELARGYVNAGSAAGFVRLHRLSDFYCRRAMEIARQTGHAPALIWVALISGIHYIGRGQWSRVQEWSAEAIELARRLGDERRWSDITVNLADVFYYKGRFTEALRLKEEVRMAADRRRELRSAASGLRGKVYSLVTMGRVAEAKACLDSIREIVGQGLPAEREMTELDLDAFTALFDLWEGDAASAFSAAERAAARIERFSKGVSFYNVIIPCATVAEVCFSLLDHPLDLDREAVRRTARNVCHALRVFSRIFPIARPAAWLYQGKYERLSGRLRKALSACKSCSREAELLGMTWFRACAEQEIACHLAVREREQHLQTARALFSKMGVPMPAQIPWS